MEFSVKRINTDADCTVFREMSELDKNCIGADGWSADSFRSEAEKENGIVICAYIQNHVAGLICGYYAGGEADITSVAVDCNFRRNGIASALMTEFEKNLPADTEEIFLEVRESNYSAISLYRKYGFTMLSVRKNFYQNPPENAIVMKKSVKEGI